MSTTTTTTTTTKPVLLLVDPLNDFVHPKGKLYGLLQESLTATKSLDNMTRLVQGARNAGISIYYGLHQQWEPGKYSGWNHMRPVHQMTDQGHTFGGWGGEILEGFEPNLDNGDVVVSRHWNSSSFKGTDLDYQLRQRDVTHLIMAGMVANTCIESTAREAIELGYKVTLVSDATAGFSQALKEAATDIIWPTIVDEVLNTNEWLAKIEKK